MKKAFAMIIITALLAVVFPVACPILAAERIVLTISAGSTDIDIGDEVIITIRMSDASATDFSAFSFNIKLSGGLQYISGSGRIPAAFRNATDITTVAFDEVPFLMASGFGGPYNGGAIDIVVFTCKAVSAGQAAVSLADVQLLNANARVIPVDVAPAVIAVHQVSSGGIGSGNQSVGSDNSAGSLGSSAGSTGGSPNGSGNSTSGSIGGLTEVPSPGAPGTGINSAMESDGGQTGDNQPWVNLFEDIKPSDWFYDSVSWVQSRGLMSGTAQGVFNPNAPMTRAMLVTVLHRAAGNPASEAGLGFIDVSEDAWYAESVGWATANGIVSGMSATVFAPEDSITREQIATLLYRFANNNGTDVSSRADLNRFTDAGEISEYARETVAWAVSAGLITGRRGDILDPKANATRAEVAAILQRYIG